MCKCIFFSKRNPRVLLSRIVSSPRLREVTFYVINLCSGKIEHLGYANIRNVIKIVLEKKKNQINTCYLGWDLRVYCTSGGSLYRHYLVTMMRGLFFPIIIPEKIINSSLAGTDLLYIKWSHESLIVPPTQDCLPHHQSPEGSYSLKVSNVREWHQSRHQQLGKKKLKIPRDNCIAVLV